MYGSADLQRVDHENRPSLTTHNVLLPNQSRVSAKDQTKPGAQASGTVECAVRASHMRPDTPKECMFQAVAAPRVEDFYPAASQRIGEEGPVEFAFKREDAEGWARDISVVGSSLSERLDQAAVQYLSNAIFSTPCPGTRYEAASRVQAHRMGSTRAKQSASGGQALGAAERRSRSTGKGS
jgi:outer membrane biosynthesis protein TonB